MRPLIIEILASAIVGCQATSNGIAGDSPISINSNPTIDEEANLNVSNLMKGPEALFTFKPGI